MTSLPWGYVKYMFSRNTHGPWLVRSDWLLSSHRSTTWPCCKLDLDSGTPESAADRPENQGSTTWSWSEKSRFISIGALCAHGWWNAFFFRFSDLKRSYYLGMVRRATEHRRTVLWAANWNEPIHAVNQYPTENPWPCFVNKCESNRQSPRLSY